MARLAAAHPDPESELNWTTPYELLVAVVLSAQATDKGSTSPPRALRGEHAGGDRKLGVEGLTPYVKTIGLYRNKAKNVVALSEMLWRVTGRSAGRLRRADVAPPAWGGRPRTSFSTSPRRPHDAGRHARLPRRQPHEVRAGKTLTKWRRFCSSASPRNSPFTRTTTFCFTAAIAARRAFARVRTLPGGGLLLGA